MVQLEASMSLHLDGSLFETNRLETHENKESESISVINIYINALVSMSICKTQNNPADY